MMEKPDFVQTDIINQLKLTHENLETMSPDEIRAVLTEAIQTTRDFRILIGILDEIFLEDMPPEGKAEPAPLEGE